MVQQLFDQANGLNSMRPVLSSVFSDGVMSWGRIASVLALGAVVCERLKQDHVEEHAEECVDVVASHISTYLGTDLQLWLINNNSWVSTVGYWFRTWTCTHSCATVCMSNCMCNVYMCVTSVFVCFTGWFCGVLSC